MIIDIGLQSGQIVTVTSLTVFCYSMTKRRKQKSGSNLSL